MYFVRRKEIFVCVEEEEDAFLYLVRRKKMGGCGKEDVVRCGKKIHLRADRKKNGSVGEE